MSKLNSTSISAAGTKPVLQSPAIDRNAFTISEACRRLSISRASLYRLNATGEIRTVRLGGRRLVPASEIVRVLGDEAA